MEEETESGGSPLKIANGPQTVQRIESCVEYEIGIYLQLLPTSFKSTIFIEFQRDTTKQPIGITVL